METTMRELVGTADDQLQQQVIRKVARRLIPVMCLLYFINYLDRTNVGFAALTMNKDIGLTTTMYGLGAGLFFIGYFLFEVPSNLALHRFGARLWITRIVVTWGVVAAAMAFVQGPHSFYGLRVLLGIAEAGFFPGMILYLTYWFPRRDRARMTSLFYMALPLSTVLGAPLSTLLMRHGDGVFGFAGWRFMYLVEGLAAVLLGFVAYRFLTDRPETARWLSPDERRWLTDTIAAEDAGTDGGRRRSVARTLVNPRVLALALAYFGIVFGLYSIGFFLPQMIEGFQQQFGTQFSIVEVGLVTAVPYAVATVAMLLWSRHSDRTGERVWHVALPAFLGAAAVAVSLHLGSPLLIMAGITVTAVGIFSAVPTLWQLPSAFLTGTAAAAGIGLINSIGNLSGFVGPYLTGWLKDLTGSFQAGMLVVASCMALSGLTVLALAARTRTRQPAHKAGGDLAVAVDSVV
jgi:ACS family tartrate transporter-like MFS transporter